MDTPAQRNQRAKALDRANEVRAWRKEIRRKLAAGELDPVDLLYKPPVALCNVELLEFLTWIPGIGRPRAKELLRGRVTPTVLLLQIGEIVPRVRNIVASALRSR